MERAVSKYAPYLYVLLRVVAGLLFACHGAQKLFGVFGGVGGPPGAAVPLSSLMGLAGCIELVGGLLIALGILTNLAAFVASGEMAFAYFMQHFPRGFWRFKMTGSEPCCTAFCSSTLPLTVPAWEGGGGVVRLPLRRRPNIRRPS